jgi:hypothetical protein
VGTPVKSGNRVGCGHVRKRVIGEHDDIGQPEEKRGTRHRRPDHDENGRDDA